MIKQLKFLLLGIIVGALIVFAMYRNGSKKKIQEDADLVIERIEAVKKADSYRRILLRII